MRGAYVLRRPWAPQAAEDAPLAKKNLPSTVGSHCDEKAFITTVNLCVQVVIRQCPTQRHVGEDEFSPYQPT